MKELKLFICRLLEDGNFSYDCALCGHSTLDHESIMDHLEEVHKKEDHHSDDCPDLKRHEDHFSYRGRK